MREHIYVTQHCSHCYHTFTHSFNLYIYIRTIHGANSNFLTLAAFYCYIIGIMTALLLNNNALSLLLCPLHSHVFYTLNRSNKTSANAAAMACSLHDFQIYYESLG